MKKLGLALIFVLFFAPSLHAASIFSSYSVSVDQDRTKSLAPVRITSEADGEVNTFGIEIYLEENERILWHDEGQTITASGSAVQAGRLSAEPKVTYLTNVSEYTNYKIVHIAVDEPFLKGEEVILEGLALRSYDRSFGNRALRLNLDESPDFEASDINFYRVNDNSNGDKVAPYIPYNFDYQISEQNSAPQVNLSWSVPPDYDLYQIKVERQLIENGNVVFTKPLVLGLADKYTDTGLDWGDEVVYLLSSRDEIQWSQVIEIPVMISEPVEEPSPQTPDSETPEEAPNGLWEVLKPSKNCVLGSIDRCFLWELFYQFNLMY